MRAPASRTCTLAEEAGCSPCQATGEGRKEVLVLTGPSGMVAPARRELARASGLDLEADCWTASAVRCATQAPAGWAPGKNDLQCCQARVAELIRDLHPRLVLMFGEEPVESVIGAMWPDAGGGIIRWRGWTIPDRERGLWLCPSLYPNEGTRESHWSPVTGVVFRQDIARALAKLDEPLPRWPDEREAVRVIEDDRNAIHAIEVAGVERELLSFDFETTGRKPYVSGHRILTCALSSAAETVAFNVTDAVKPRLAALLADERVPKAAHGLKFEDCWASVMLGPVRGWRWCSMTAANILENRLGVVGLKFQAFARFGLPDYSSHLDRFIGAAEDEDKKDANAFNTLDQAPRRDVLLYNGIDALVGRRLALLQMKEIGADPRLSRAYELFHRGLLSMAEVEQNGMAIDLPYVKGQYDHLTERRIPALEAELAGSEAIAMWRARYGDKFNMGSDEQLGTVLVEDLGLELPETKSSSEKKRRYSVAAAALEVVEDDAPFVRQLMDAERLKKLASTHLRGLIREAPDGWLHPFFNLGGGNDGENVVTSYRGSSSAINFQNIPVRHPDIKKIIRRAFVPRPGRLILEIDFKGIEVATSACVHKDPQMIEYVTDETTDMHRDMAMDLYMLGEGEWTKPIRQVAKNKYVFPEFYGSYWKQVAPDLWRAIKREKLATRSGVPLMEHLRDKGITGLGRLGAKDRPSPGSFYAHVRDVEDDFWGRRFAGYTAWKQEHAKRYERLGYFYLVTGFRVAGVLRRNQVLSLPIQGPAFHCLLWTLNRVRDIAHDEGWETLLIGQIHDSALADTVPGERDHVIATFKRVVAEELPEAFKWIIVPFRIEVEATGVDQSWYYKQEVK